MEEKEEEAKKELCWGGGIKIHGLKLILYNVW